MKEALIALNTITQDGVIGGYAIGVAIGASFYIEATSTEDIDAFVFLAPAKGSSLISLAPIYDALKKIGGVVEKEHVRFGNWPVQILPAYKPLVEDALRESQAVEFAGVPTHIFIPEYLCAIALDTGRTKDYYRIAMFIEQDAVDMNLLRSLVDRYGLSAKVKTCRTGKIKMDNQLLFEQAIRAKAAYHKDARAALTWEEKVASIERMREASTEARKAMGKARQHNQSLNPK